MRKDYIPKTDRKKQRKHLVLRNIVHVYVGTGIPVSSRVVAGMMGEDISSATIRNIMSELEDDGYIEQPHTSAGRVPTHSGYRRYVDMVKSCIRFEKAQAEKLEAEYERRIRTIKEMIEKTSFLISRELRSAGVVMWPSMLDLHLKHLELFRIKAETVLAVLVTASSAVKNYIVKLNEDLAGADLEKIANYINDRFGYRVFTDIYEELRHKADNPSAGDTREERDLIRNAFGIVDSVFRSNMVNEVYWEGLNYLVEEPGTFNIDLVRSLLRTFSAKDTISELMQRELPEKGIRVYIGEENLCDSLKGCTVITSGYTLYGRTAGRIGVIGPTRMDYDRALATINCISDVLSEKLRRMNY